MSWQPAVLLRLVAILALMPVYQSAMADSDPPPGKRQSQVRLDQDSRREFSLQPPESLAPAVEAFKKSDSTAAFRFYQGHVDSFSSHPKPKVPAYAVDLLRARGLPIEPRRNEYLPTAETDKKFQDLDADLAHRLPVPYEEDAKNADGKPERDDDPPRQEGPDTAKVHERTRPARPVEKQEPPWMRPDSKNLEREASVAKPVLAAFLSRHSALFELPKEDLAAGLPSLEQTDYSVGRYARRAVFEQTVSGQPVIGGKLVVLFDRNWNVTSISRMIATPQKLDIAKSEAIGEKRARKLAVKALAVKTQTKPGQWKVADAVLGIDPVRLKRIWVVNARVPGGTDLDMRVKLDAATGEVLNISDNVDRYTDAQVRRWGYSGGNLEAPSQYVSGSFYTRDDNTLVHDFFHIVTDERGGGDPQTTCTETDKDSLWYEEAYDTTTGSSYVRPTRRSDRNFSLWYPHNPSGSFSESNSYYWARWFFQWIKGSISDLGELPASAADYPQVLIVTNACISAGGSHNSTFEVTTYQDQGEGIPVIRLPEKCRSSNANCAPADYTGFGTFKTCEGNGCSTPPSVIHHEINHFLLKTYYDVGSGLDCSAGEQLKFVHEGILGSAVPQAYWHHYYGVGYSPPDNFLYKADYDAGRVHVDDASNIRLSDYWCDDDGDPYKSGRVAGQVMWEIYHGKAVNGSTITSMARPATDRDFLVLTYWAAELVDASTFKDRYEYANRVMEIMENHSSLSSTDKQKWCDAWEHHELRSFIDNSYCS